MLVYRITKVKYASELVASGFRNRWNDDGQYVIYTSDSRALACLENLVHRSNSGNDLLFSTMIISIPNELSVLTVQEKDLSRGWRKGYCEACLQMGKKWYIENKFPILKTPSSIIPNEWNYILNTRHQDFSNIKLIGTEGFRFDERL